MSDKKLARYKRIQDQLEALFTQTSDPYARMATAAAVLHHKIGYYFWTGFYLLKDGELTVGPYQGSVACLVLKKDTGVCWEGVNTEKPVIVDDVHTFPGHIACDSRSKSEIVIPLRDNKGKTVGVLDIDSDKTASFDQSDAEGLAAIVSMIYGK